MREPITKCGVCRGEGIRAGAFGPRVCGVCHGAGLRATRGLRRPEPVAKVCACCGRAFDSDRWTALEYVGVQDDGDGGFLELRNCHCGSTIAVEAVAA